MGEEYSERVSTSVNEAFKKKIRIEAAKRDMTMSEFLREILEKEFEVSEGNAKRPMMAN